MNPSIEIRSFVNQPTPRLSRFAIFIILFVLSSLFTIWLDRQISPSKNTSLSQHRIVSIAPNITDVIFRIGAADQLVGISDFCHPPEDVSLPRCGGLLNPNYERILKLGPDIIFLSGQMDRVQIFAKEHSILALPIQIDHFEPLIEAIKKIGTLTQHEEEARKLIVDLNAQLARVKEVSKDLPKYRALVILGRESGALRGSMAVSNTSFIGEMLTVANGENIFSDQKQPYFTPSREAIIAAQPDVIFELRRSEPAHDPNKATFEWSKDSEIPAVRNNRIIPLHHDFMTTPGPKMIEIAEVFQGYFKKFAEEDRKKKR
jgi:iron complex transport system substrate-binding protein